MFYDDSGYDLNDPKHPTFHDRYADAADRRRKADRENARTCDRDDDCLLGPQHPGECLTGGKS